MSNFRITTNGLYRNYRTNLSKNNKSLNDAMTTVQTGRKFNTYAEDPAAASKAWRLRRSYWRTGDQIDNTNYAISKFESAYNAMGSIVDGDVGNGEYGLGLDSILASIKGLNGAAGSSRSALGKELVQTAENMVASMNTKYGDDFVFAGADGENVPFQWDNGKLYYRNIDVNTPRTDYVREDFIKDDGSFDQAKYDAAKAAYQEANPKWASDDKAFDNAMELNRMANEATYLDVGIGMKEKERGEMITGSAFNTAISGIKFLNYGEDKNLAVLVHELGEIYSRADPDTGEYHSAEDKGRADELVNRLHNAIAYSQEQHVQLDADAKYLRTNLSQLELNKSELDKQIVETEDKEMGDAITEMTWAKYCYDAALRIGTNILSQSLLDYMS